MAIVAKEMQMVIVPVDVFVIIFAVMPERLSDQTGIYQKGDSTIDSSTRDIFVPAADLGIDSISIEMVVCLENVIDNYLSWQG
jgi:hypothetical protein